MSTSQKPLLEISPTDINQYLEDAEEFLSFDVHVDSSAAMENLEAAKKTADSINVDDFLARAPQNQSEGNKPGGGMKYGSSPSRRSQTILLAQQNSVMGIADKYSPGRLIMSEPINHTLNALRKSIAIGMHLSDLYAKSSGLDLLRQEEALKRLSEDNRFEFREKERTAAAIQVFIIAYYSAWSLVNFESDNLERINLICENDTSIDLHNPRIATNSLIEDLVGSLQLTGVNDEWSFVKMTLEHFRSVLDELQLSFAGLNHTDTFILHTYKVSGSDFVIEGFNFDLSHVVEQLNVKPVTFEDIVGNVEAIHETKRMVDWLMCYDFNAEMNPILEIGGFPTMRMGMGVPGTGKSLQIAATINRGVMRSTQISVPFIYIPFPSDIVDKYQGESGKKAAREMQILGNRNRLMYMYMDDSENLVMDRTMDGVSEGVKAVVAEILRFTEGANAVHVGNWFWDFMTNIPEHIDKAILSRITKRFPIDGATQMEHWLVQDYKWWSHFDEIDPSLIDMELGIDYEWQASQQSATALAEKYLQYERPTTDRLQNIFDKVYEQFKRTRKKPPEYYHEFFAELDQAVAELYPFYRNRDKRNIQTAVDNRIMDFFIPEDWFEHPDRFYFGVPDGETQYQTKKEMILELVRENLGGKSLGQIRLQETVYYMEGMVKILDADYQRKLNAEIERQEVFTEAQAKRKEQMS